MSVPTTKAGTPTAPSVGLLGVLGLFPPLIGAAFVVTMRILMAFGVSFSLAAIAGAASVVGLAVGSFGMAGLRTIRASRPRTAEVLVVLLLIAIAVFVWGQGADRSILWPHSFGVDQAHHAAITSYLLETGHLPTQSSWLGSLWNYPIGSHLLAAAAARAFHLNPISAMWLTGVGSVFLQVFTIAWVTRNASPKRSLSGSLPAVAVWVLAWEMGIGSISVAFFLAQSMSVCFSLAGVGLIALARRGLPLRQWLPAVAVLALAAYFTYPQNVLIVPAALLVSVPFDRFAAGRLRRSLRWRAWFAAIPVIAVVFGVVGWRWAKESGYFTLQAVSGNGEGSLPTFTAKLFGGPIVCALITWGLIEVLISSVRGHRSARALLGAIVAPLGMAGGLWLLRQSGTPVTMYRIKKNMYLAFPFLTVAVGLAFAVALNALAHRLRASRWGGLTRFGPATLAAGVALAFLVRPIPLRATSLPLVDRDAYLLGTFAAAHYPVNEIGLAGDGLSPYAIWWVAFHLAPPTDWDDLVPKASKWNDWPAGNTTQKYLLVDASKSADYIARPNVRVLRTRGRAVLLERVN